MTKYKISEEEIVKFGKEIKVDLGFAQTRNIMRTAFKNDDERRMMKVNIDADITGTAEYEFELFKVRITASTIWKQGYCTEVTFTVKPQEVIR